MGTGELQRELALDAILKDLKEVSDSDVDYSLTGDWMAHIHIMDTEGTTTLYRSGNFQIRGASSIEKLYQTRDKFLDLIGQLGIVTNDVPFWISNLVYVGDLDLNLRLEVVAVQLGLKHTEYEAEQFPAVIYRPPEVPTATLLIFSSGKVVVNGTTEEETALRAFDCLQESLEMDATV